MTPAVQSDARRPKARAAAAAIMFLALMGAQASAQTELPRYKGDKLRMEIDGAPRGASIMIMERGYDHPALLPEGVALVTYLPFGGPASAERDLIDLLTVVAHLRRSARWWNGRLYILSLNDFASSAMTAAALLPEARGLVLFNPPQAAPGDALPAAVETLILSPDGPGPLCKETDVSIRVRPLLPEAEQDVRRNLWTCAAGFFEKLESDATMGTSQ